MNSSLSFGIVLLVASSLLGCGDDDDAGQAGTGGAGGSSATSTSSGSSASSTASTGSASSSSTGGSGGGGSQCHQLENTAEVALVSEPSPGLPGLPSQGAIDDGTYELEQIFYFGSAPVDPPQVRETIEVTNVWWYIVSREGMGPDEHITAEAMFSAAARSFCPPNTTWPFAENADYSAGDTYLTLFAMVGSQPDFAYRYERTN